MPAMLQAVIHVLSRRWSEFSAHHPILKLTPSDKQQGFHIFLIET